MKISGIAIFLVFLLSCQPKPEANWQKNDADQKMVKAIFDEIMDNGKAYDDLRELSYDIGHRLSGSEGADKAVLWSKAKMEGYGYDNVFLQEVMVPHWERGSKESFKILGSSEGDISLKLLAIGGSIATPKKGIRAEVIRLESVNDLEKVGKEKIEGKIVFFDGKFNQKYMVPGQAYGETGRQRFEGAFKARDYGALAVVIRALSSKADDFPHTGGGRYEKDGKDIPSGSLSYIGADKLAEILEKDGKVTVEVKINSQWHEDKLSHNVIGELKGSEHPDKYIMVCGHLDSWDVGHGAHDDGSGCVQSIEALRVLKKLGYKPRHTLRAVMMMNEENGLRGGNKYAKIAKEKNEVHIAAMESDAGGFSPRGFGVTASDESIEMMRNWLAYFDPITINYIRKGGGGADIGPLNREMGTPTIGLLPDPQRYFDFHHTENDLFEFVNKRELHLGAASMAAMIYLIDKYGFKP
jgi:carboxypeptidase Q